MAVHPVLRGAARARGRDDDALAGRIVLVGVTAKAAADVFVVQEGFGSRLVHGVELHADAIATMASGQVPRLATAGLQALSAGLLALAGAALAIVVPRSSLLAAALAALAALWIVACLALARRGWLLNPAYDVAALLLGAAFVHGLLRLARRFAARGQA